MRRLALASMLFALGAAGCLGGFSGLHAGGDGGTATMDMGVDVRAAYYANVAPILDGSCGACHAKQGGIGPGFLAQNPDELTTLLSYPGLVSATPDTSRVYAKGLHEGPALTAAQAPVVADWINLYNAHKPQSGDGGVKPTVAPFKPVMGANTIDLAALDSQLLGAKLTFDAKMVGTSIELSSITVVTPKTTGVHLVHPLWVKWDQYYNPTPDPVDSFSNLDETVPANMQAPLGPGELILPGFDSTMLLSVVFTTAEPKDIGVSDGGTVLGGCKNLQGWQQNVKPTLKGTCGGCHAATGNNAAMAFDLTMINDANNAGDPQACVNTLGEVDVNTPANSRIYTYTDPASGIQHPFKFPQKSSFADAWITTEK